MAKPAPRTKKNATAAKKGAAKKGVAKKGAAKKAPATAPREGIFSHYLALFEELTRKVSRIVAWRGSLRFPAGGADKWRAKKHAYEAETVGAILEQWSRDVASGARYLDVRLDGDCVEIVGWDWRDDWESSSHTLANVLDAAAPLQPKGGLEIHARESDGRCQFVSYTFRGKKLDIDEGETSWESKRMQAALADVAPAIEAWLAEHPATRVRHQKAGLFGYVDRAGREVIEPQFTRAYEFSEGIANVQDDRGARLLDATGRLLPGTYFLTDYCLRGLAPVAVAQDLYGYVDRAGAMCIEPKFAKAEPFRGPLSIVTVGASLHEHRRRWLTPEGALVGDAVEYTHGFTEDLAWVYRSDQESYGCIDATAQPAFVRRFRATLAYAEGLAAVWETKASTKWGYVDRAGNVVIAPRFDEAHSFSEGRAVVRIGKKFHLIDRAGAIVGDPFDGFGGAGMSEGMIAVLVKGKVGFADQNGKLVIPARYEDGYGFHDGRAYVAAKPKKGGPARWGHLDRNGDFAIAPTLEWTNRFRDGLAPAKDAGLFGFIDRAGAWVIPPRYGAMQPSFGDDLAWFQLP